MLKTHGLQNNPDVGLPKAGKGTSKTLQLRIFRKLEVTEDLTFSEVLVASGYACSPLPKVPLQLFSSTPARFSECIFFKWRDNFVG